jgi:glutamate synthase domain-containing protein 1
MCGIAGIMYKNGSADIGTTMTAMLDSLKHRGPDSTGYALYKPPAAAGNGSDDHFTLWVKWDEPAEDRFGRRAYAAAQRERIYEQIAAAGGRVTGSDQPLDYILKLDVDYQGDLKALEDRVENLGDVEIVSLGRSMELIKDIGVAVEVADAYHINGFQGTHAIGHTRMATESAVDISHAHPFWAYPFADIAVVHNGQITNYHKNRHLLEREGHRFRSHCDSELIAVYIADKLRAGLSLEESLRQSQQDLDGVYTYFVCTENEIGVAKDELAAKPLVVMEDDDVVALASEEVAIRQVFKNEITSWDPYDGEVMVWSR